MIIDGAVYQDGERRPGELALDEAYEAGCADNAFVWIGLYETEFDSVRREFNLHELAVEDAITAHQRPRLEVYDDTLFVVAVRHKPASALGDVRKVIEFHQAAVPLTEPLDRWPTAWSRGCTASWASTSATSRTTWCAWSRRSTASGTC
jgi:hypothetical protein